MCPMPVTAGLEYGEKNADNKEKEVSTRFQNVRTLATRASRVAAARADFAAVLRNQ